MFSLPGAFISFQREALLPLSVCLRSSTSEGPSAGARKFPPVPRVRHSRPSANTFFFTCSWILSLHQTVHTRGWQFYNRAL